MPRTYNQSTIAILKHLAQEPRRTAVQIRNACSLKMGDKDFYNYLFRLQNQGLISKEGNIFSLSEDGKLLLLRMAPDRDGVWKLVIFDIPEKHKYVRNVLRAKLRQLHFKKWQNSIWISPYALEPEIEEEFNALGKKFFVRLIKTNFINFAEDLEELFKE